MIYINIIKRFKRNYYFFFLLSFVFFQLSDYLPNPYPNEEAARAANSGLKHKSVYFCDLESFELTLPC